MRHERKKERYLLFMLPGLCHVGCARMAGQKYLIKVFFWCLRGEVRGFARISSLVCRPFYFHALSLLPRPTILHRSGGYCFIQRQVTHVDLLSTAMDKQRFYCSTLLEVSILFAKFICKFIIEELVALIIIHLRH